MAGAGYKLFATGDVLSASDVNLYLQQQTVMVFASAAARTTALASVLAEGMVTYLKDTDVVEIYTGAAWVSLDDPNAIQNSIVDAKGDIITATADNTPARLAVGATNGMTLQVDSSTATGLKWASPAAATSGMTLINRTTYSSAATITVDGCFTGTYSSYVVVMEGIGCVNATDSMRIKFRDSGGNLTAATYYGNALTTQHYNTTVTSTPSSGLTYLQLTTGGMGGQGAGTYGRAWYQFQGVGNTSENSVMFGNHYTTNNTQNNLFGGSYTTSAIVTGFQILSSGTNVAGTIAVYGLAEA